MRGLLEQLRQQMDRHEINADLLGLERIPRKLSTEHFNWLALYQVKGMRYAEVARVVQPTWPTKDTDLKNLTETVRSGIQDAAQLVVGLSWKSWLRQGKPGRPKSV